MAKVLVAAAIAWPILLGAATWRAATGVSSSWAALTYTVGSVICHQRPERSFHTASTKWPVCARCAGLYLAAPLGAVLAFAARRHRRPAAPRAALIRWLAVASLPTALTWMGEWTGMLAVGNAARFIAALPLGAAIAALIVSVAHPGDLRP